MAPTTKVSPRTPGSDVSTTRSPTPRCAAAAKRSSIAIDDCARAVAAARAVTSANPATTAENRGHTPSAMRASHSGLGHGYRRVLPPGADEQHGHHRPMPHFVRDAPAEEIRQKLV